MHNVDGVAGGEGVRLNIPKIDDYSDGELSPGESVEIYFGICLMNKDPFSFTVDVYGYKDD